MSPSKWSKSFTHPSFVFKEIPCVASGDSLGYKIEALRVYLEKKMGFDDFFSAYTSLMEGSEQEESNTTEHIHEIKVSKEAEKYIPFIHHLIFCEINHFSN